MQLSLPYSRMASPCLAHMHLLYFFSLKEQKMYLLKQLDFKCGVEQFQF